MIRQNSVARLTATLLCVACALIVWSYATEANAALPNEEVFDNVLGRYSTAARAWAQVVTDAASWLFWTLTAISMVWTFGMLALRRAELGEMLAELFRFTVFTGFYFWLLSNGPAIANAIFRSMDELAVRASGLDSHLSPSSVVDVGFAIFGQVFSQFNLAQPLDSFFGGALALGILVVLTLVAVNMLLLLIKAWVLAYAGVIFLGFGGSRWTSEIAINYFRTVLGVAVQLFTMVLIVGIGKTFVADYYHQMLVDGGIQVRDMAVMVVVSVILLQLCNKLPAIVSGIATGASLGTVGFGASEVMAVAGVAASAASAGLVGALGGVHAVTTAVSSARDAAGSGQDLLTAGAQMLGVGGGSEGGSAGQGVAGGMDGEYARAAGIYENAGSASKGAETARPGAFRVAARVGGHLAKGVMQVGKEKVRSAYSSEGLVGRSLGGQVARAIREGQAKRAASSRPDNAIGPALPEAED